MDAQLHQTATKKRSNPMTVLLGILAAGLVAAVLSNTNAQLPLVSNDRAALLALGVLGLAMCITGGIGIILPLRGWKDPITIIGSILGALVLVLVIAIFAGISLPLIATDHDAFIVLAGIGILKVIVMAIDSLRR